MTTAPDAADELARADAIVATHEMVVSLDATSVVVRLKGKGPDAIYTALTPEAAVRIGAAFLRGAARLKPGLTIQVAEDELRKAIKPLRTVNGSDGA